MKRLALLVPLAISAAAASAGAQPISLRDSFPIGAPGGIVCSAQVSALDEAFGDMFDRGYALTCRDAAAPVGRLYALRLRGGNPEARLAGLRDRRATCTAAELVQLDDVGAVRALTCRLREGDIGYRVYLKRDGDTLYAAEGLAGYDSALRLGLRSLVADAPAPGLVSVATTGAGDAASFARAQAGTLDPRRALAEAYRRNNAGSYAEASEFFASLLAIEEPATRAEAVVNRALQSSNLGYYAEAEALFARAAAMSGGDPVLRRRVRNYTALHLLNQGDPGAALIELDRAVDDMTGMAMPAAPEIDIPLAERLNSEAPGRATLDRASGTLTPAEKVQILDGQALQLRGTILRLRGDLDAAVPLLQRAATELQAVRGGVVASTVWMRAQVFAELAAVAEARRQPAEAERLYREGVALLAADYPASAALLSAQARLASYLARAGRDAEAIALYRQLVTDNAGTGTGSDVLRRALEPYFTLLTAPQAPPDAAADLFLASQVSLRPGVAQTQAVLARELSEGSDEAARLFRQSVALTRDVERTRVELARLQAGAEDAQQVAAAAALAVRLEEIQQAQVATQAQLAAFPRYRAIDTGALTLEQLQRQLRPDEAYYRLAVMGRSVFAILVKPEGARAFRADVTPEQLGERVAAIRGTILDDQLNTYPFDLENAHALYRSLIAPVAGELAGVRHLVFEPDGAMLQLPLNLLVEDQVSIDAYRRRVADPDDEGFDFTGTRWFGRNRQISTAVSPRAFRDIRAATPSRARNEYAGFGQNAPVGEVTAASLNLRMEGAGEGCGWALAAWNAPISPRELLTASRVVRGIGGGAEVVTGPAFTDTALLARRDLDQYRVLHFATHGLLTPPAEQCPTRPALMTSFGGAESDGLLTFREIFELDLDADIVILSACDTAGRADFTVTQEAGLTTGGDYALDGLVRAFVGAGGRLVVASHWPVPQSYDATERLISGLFGSPAGTGTAAALLNAQNRLMDEPATSHPFYWAGFAVVGDGTAPVVRPQPQQTAGLD